MSVKLFLEIGKPIAYAWSQFYQAHHQCHSIMQWQGDKDENSLRIQTENYSHDDRNGCKPYTAGTECLPING